MIISWNTTNKCNMYCEHCYREAGVQADQELSTEEGKNLIDEIVKAGFKIMIFSGGEPFLRADIFELVEYASKAGLRPVFGTNGTLITLDVAKKLKEIGTMGIGISLDSLNPKKHDSFRSYEGAWREATLGMKNCRDAGLAFQIHTTVMDWNKEEILDLTDFAVSMGAVAHHLFFLVPTGRGVNIEKESLDAQQYETLLTEIMKKQQQVNIELKPTCAPQFMRIAKEMGMKLRFSRGCLAGTGYCIISPTGKVQPCAYMKIEMGDVRETPFSEIWDNHPVFKELRSLDYKGDCGICKYKKACSGCRARAAYYNQGDYMAAEPLCSYKPEKGEEIHG